MNSKNLIVIFSVFIAGLVLAWLLFNTPPAGDQTESSGYEEAGGEMKHLSQEGLEIEIGLAEEGDPPHLEASIYKDEEPVDPQTIQLMVSLTRPNKKPESLSFAVEKNHLKSLQAIAEPHVFKVQVESLYQEKTYRWEYWQVERGIELSSASLKSTGIELKTAGPASIEAVLILPGQIQPNARRMAHVVPRLEGVVTEVRKYLGDKVETGEILAVLESRDLADLKSQYLIAIRRLDLASANFERERQLWKEKISAKVDYLVAKKDWAESKALTEAAAQKLIALGLSKADLNAIASGKDTAFNRYKLRAPFSGEVVKKHLALGEAVKADAKVYTIVDLSTVWGEITVYTKNLAGVQVGRKVRIRTEDAGSIADGTVFYIEPLLGEQTRSTKAYVEITNPDRLWHPGLFVTAEVRQEEEKVAVAVAADAIQTYQDETVVFVRHDDIFEPRPVVLGKQDARWVEILEGLVAGERYASQNSFVLKSELGKSTAAHSH